MTYHAVVTLQIGNRTISNFVASAGLGVTGYFRSKRMVIDYKPGEVVESERVLSALKRVQESADAENAPFKIFGYSLERIYTTE